MNLINFVLENYKHKEEDIRELSSLPINPSENFKFSNEHIISKPAKQVIYEINIQNKLATSANKDILGYSTLRNQLESLGASTEVQIRFIESETWDGRIFQTQKKLHGVLLGKKNPISMRTPPNWDGSVEMLEKYNRTK